MKLKDKFFIGTHHSSAHKMFLDPQPKCYENDNFKYLTYIVKYSYTQGYLSRWVLTQKMKINEQIRQGINLFDIRIGVGNDNNYYTYHQFPIEKLSKTVKKFKQSVNRYVNNDIIIIRARFDTNFKCLPKKEEFKLQKYLFDKFRNYVITNFKSNSDKIKNFNGKILLFWNSIHNEGTENNFTSLQDITKNIEYNKNYPYHRIHECWYNKHSIKSMEKELNNRQKLISCPKKYSDDIIFLSYIVTPDFNTIISDPISSIIRKGCIVNNQLKKHKIKMIKNNFNSISVDGINKKFIQKINYQTFYKS